MATPDVIRKQVTPYDSEALCGHCATEMVLTDLEKSDENRILYCPKCHHVDQQSAQAFAAAMDTIAPGVTITDVYFNQLDPKDIPPLLVRQARVWKLVYTICAETRRDEQEVVILAALTPDSTIVTFTDLTGLICPLDIGDGMTCSNVLLADGSCPRHGFDKQHDPTRH
jgi:transcription elongation factor Elf1